MPGFAALSTPWWVPVVYIVVLGHITNICNTLYLHRNQTHYKIAQDARADEAEGRRTSYKNEASNDREGSSRIGKSSA